MFEHRRMSEKEFSLLSRYIEENLGIFLKPEKIQMLESRLQKQLRRNNYPNIGDFVEDLLENTKSDRAHLLLVESVTTNETSFFREAKQFEILKTQVELLLSQRKKNRFRIWSAAASTGQEAYTTAMVFEEMKGKYPDLEYSILGTDISTEVLQTAKRAIYSGQDIAKIPEELRKKYLLRAKDPGRDEFRIKKNLRHKVAFKYYNLKERSPRDFLTSFDVIFCRNVMIYFRHEFQRELASFLYSKLVPGGFLCLGHSEGMVTKHLTLDSLGSVVYRK